MGRKRNILWGRGVNVHLFVGKTNIDVKLICNLIDEVDADHCGEEQDVADEEGGEVVG